MTTSEVLLRVKNLIRDPRNWRQGAYQSEGQVCLVGAFQHLSREGVVPYQDSGSTGARHRLHQVTAHSSLEDFNDAHEHAEVLAAIDDALRAERKAAAA
jgi:hypothetical protein